VTEPTVRTAVRGTLITMGLHGLCTVPMAVPGLLAPVAATDFGYDASKVGVLVAIIYLAILLASLGSGAVLARWGDLRAAQWTGALCALSLALIALAGWTGQWLGGGATAYPALVLAAMTVLLVMAGAALGMGYGMINPIGSQILFRATPPAIRSFVFSIKQSAVPIGQMVAGLLIPLLLLVFGWQAVVFCVALLVLAYAIAMSWMRLETSEVTLSAGPAAASATAATGRRRGGMRAALAGFVAPARLAWATPSLRELAWVGIIYSANQLCLLSFLVSYLNLEIGLSLVLAGSLFSASQIGGMIGRLTWGYVADRWVTPRVQLGVLGIVGGACGALTTMFTPQWPIAVIAAVSVIYGATAASWNGVYFAEVARLGQREFQRDGQREDSGSQVGRITGGLQFYMSLGAALGPLLFTGLVGVIGTYATGFAVVALPSLLVGAQMMLTRDVADKGGDAA